jgi:hypothetical protein
MVGQRRGKSIAMNDTELATFLGEQRICRVATTGPTGPHATPLFFLWHDQAIWLTSLVGSQRWRDLTRDPRIAVIVDAGEDYRELRGVELRGTVEVVGEAPRVGDPCPELDAAEQAFADKYTNGHIVRDKKHGWLRLTPTRTTSWDFRKNSTLPNVTG